MPMERRDELIYWIWMAEGLGAGSRVGMILLRKFGSVRKIYSQTPEAAAGWSFLSQKEKAAAVNMLRQKDLREADRILERCMELGIRAISYDDSGYPEALRVIQNPPIVLYAKGSLPMVGKRFTAAVVGTRTMSDYGRKMAYSMGYGLAAGGALVVSGMALGVDSMAMMGALDAGGVTVAVLGCGVDIVYPREHIQVYRKILETGGCILSEYAPGTEPMGAHFPVRNRIISGLSDAGVVVEGDSKSGSLITARYLLYQGRKLFAVPGQVGLPGSEGPNSLICDGALPAITAEDILCEFKYMFPYSISVEAAHNAYWKLDVDANSQNTMKNTGVGTRNSRNYVGEGTYGGRSRKTPEMPPVPAEPVAGITGIPEWIYAETAKAVAESDAPAIKEAPAEPVQKTSVLDRMMQTLQGSRKEKADENGTKETKRGKVKTPEKPSADEKKKPEKQKTEKSSQKDTEKTQPAHKIDTDMLDETDMRVYNSMKPNVPMVPDELVEHGFTIGQVMAAMTALEMAGVIEAGSGGYFLRIDTDDMPVRLVEDSEIAEKLEIHPQQ